MPCNRGITAMIVTVHLRPSVVCDCLHLSSLRAEKDPPDQSGVFRNRSSGLPNLTRRCLHARHRIPSIDDARRPIRQVLMIDRSMVRGDDDRVEVLHPVTVPSQRNKRPSNADAARVGRITGTYGS